MEDVNDNYEEKYEEFIKNHNLDNILEFYTEDDSDTQDEINKAKNRIGKLLVDFSKKEKNPKFEAMVIDLLNYRRLCQENDKDIIKTPKVGNFKPLLYYFLEKQLVEIVYINNNDFRKEKIAKLNQWFRDKIKCYDELKYITKKTYKEDGLMDDEEILALKFPSENNKYKSITEEIKEQLDHRTTNLFNKRMLEDYKRKHISKYLGQKKYILKNPVPKEEQNQKTLKLVPGKPRPFFMSNFSSIYSNEHETNSFSIKQYSKEKNFKDSVEGGETEKKYHSSFLDGIDHSLPSLCREPKFSYSFNRPPYNYKLMSIEKTIIDNKMKLVSEKRAEEEICSKLEEFGLQRAKYKENVMNKHEIKELIKMYSKKNNFHSLLLRKYNNHSKSVADIQEKNKFDSSNFNKKKEETSTYKRKDEFNLHFFKRKSSNNLYFNKDLILLSEQNEEPEEFTTNQVSPIYKKSKTLSQGLNISKTFNKKMGNKMIINEIRNVDNETLIIKDQPEDKIKKFTIVLKNPKDGVKKIKLLHCLSAKNLPSDSVYKFFYNNKIEKQKFLDKGICNLKTKIIGFSKDINSNNISQNELTDYSSKKKFVLSAYSRDNYKQIENFKKMEIKNKINNCSNNRFIKLNCSYQLNQDNFLGMRKSISNLKKAECEALLNKINRKKIEGSCFLKEEGNLSASLNNKSDIFQNIGHLRFKNQKSLLNAIINPNEDSNYSQYFLPHSGSKLLSRLEPIKKKKKEKV